MMVQILLVRQLILWLADLFHWSSQSPGFIAKPYCNVSIQDLYGFVIMS